MSTRGLFHTKDNGEIDRCRADYQCPFESNGGHHETRSEARSAFEATMEAEGANTLGVKNKVAQTADSFSNGESATIGNMVFSLESQDYGTIVIAAADAPNMAGDDSIRVVQSNGTGKIKAYALVGNQRFPLESAESYTDDQGDFGSLASAAHRAHREALSRFPEAFVEDVEANDAYWKITDESDDNSLFIPQLNAGMNKTSPVAPQVFEADFEDGSSLYVRVRHGVASARFTRPGDSESTPVYSESLNVDSGQADGAFPDTKHRNQFMAKMYMAMVEKNLLPTVETETDDEYYDSWVSKPSY